MTKREVIENLELHPLEIEGGFFREVYRSRTPVEITAPDGEKNAYAASSPSIICWDAGMFPACILLNLTKLGIFTLQAIREFLSI